MERGGPRTVGPADYDQSFQSLKLFCSNLVFDGVKSARFGGNWWSFGEKGMLNGVRRVRPMGWRVGGDGGKFFEKG